MTRPSDRLTFDAAAHAYTLDGKPCEGVTSVLERMMPGFEADPFYLQKGTSVHACMAMIARGARFTCDPRISGQVEAGRLFWREMGPDPLAVEARVFSARHGYAGCLDLACWIGGKFMLVDYKASIRPSTGHQLAAYGLAAGECGLCPVGQIRRGLAVVLKPDGKYSTKEYDLRPLTAEWLALLGADRVLRKHGVTA